MARFRLITFDATNTLLKLTTSVGEQYATIGHDYGIKFKCQDAADRLNKSFKEVWNRTMQSDPNFGQTTGLTSQQWWSKVVVDTFESADCLEHVDQQKLNLVAGLLYKMYSTRNCWTVNQFVHPVLTKLKNKHPHLKFGVISNFDERLEPILVDVGLRHYFELIVTSVGAECLKPSRQIFDFALKNLEIKSPKTALHIGDDLTMDYLGAKDAGWSALLLKHPNLISNFDLVRIDLNEVISCLSEIISHKYLIEK